MTLLAWAYGGTAGALAGAFATAVACGPGAALHIMLVIYICRTLL